MIKAVEYRSLHLFNGRKVFCMACSSLLKPDASGGKTLDKIYIVNFDEVPMFIYLEILRKQSVNPRDFGILYKDDYGNGTTICYICKDCYKEHFE